MVVERKNIHILEVARALLFQSHVPKRFLGEVVLTTTYLINRMPPRVLNYNTTMDTLLSVYPHSHLVSNIPLKLFGCTTFVHIYPHNCNKLDARAIRCIILGYSSNKRGYKCFSPVTQKLYHTMDVTFFEHQPYFPHSVI